MGKSSNKRYESGGVVVLGVGGVRVFMGKRCTTTGVGAGLYKN